ncbi:MAG: hypothetical protein U0271_29610 [Polyangiaceae bacterium]
MPASPPSIPKLPRVVVWDDGSPAAKQVRTVLERAHLEHDVRELATAPPSAEELAMVSGWLPTRVRLALPTSAPVAVAPAEQRAILAQPPELVLALFAPEAGDGRSPAELVRASFRRGAAL